MPLPVPLARRTLIWRRNHFWLIVDELSGKGQAVAASYIHLHPNLLLESVEESVWRIQGCRTPLWLTAFGQQGQSVVAGQMEPHIQGWYSERFGQLQRNTVLTLNWQGALPLCYGYIISRYKPTRVKVRSSGDGHQVSVTQDGRSHTFGISSNAIIRFQ